MRPRRHRPFAAVLPWALAVLTAGGTYVAIRGAGGVAAEDPVPLLADGVAFDETRALERRWLDEAFAERYLPAPALDLPCPTGVRAASPWSLRISDALDNAAARDVEGAVRDLREIDRRDPSNWVPGLALGLLLLRNGRLEEAEDFLGDAAGRSLLLSRVRSAAEAVERRRPYRGPLSEDALGAVHLLHAHAYAQIETGRAGSGTVQAVVQAIAAARLLALRNFDERDLRGAGWLHLRLPSPGCRATAASLTPLDLYNNLLVAYLVDGTPDVSADEWRRESRRGYRAPPHENPLLAVLERFAEDSSRAGDPRSWALSEAERLLEPLDGVDELGDARLAYNLAALVESVIGEVPEEGRPHLRQLGDELVGIATAGREDVEARQRPAFHQGLVRLLLLRAAASPQAAALPEDAVADLDAAQQEAAGRLQAAFELRRDADAWVARLRDGGAEARLVLGEASAAYLAAGRRDVATALARVGAAATSEERRWWAVQARYVLAPGDVPPPELVTLESGAEPESSSRAAAFFAALLAAAAAWIVGWWLSRQLMIRADLRTSFYRLEARRRLRSGIRS